MYFAIAALQPNSWINLSFKVKTVPSNIVGKKKKKKPKGQNPFEVARTHSQTLSLLPQVS